MNTNRVNPHIAIHPGFFLKEELESRSISQREFAHDIALSKTILNEVINEKRSVTPDMALSFEKALDIPAEFWVDFQSRYDIDKARLTEKNTLKTRQIELWKCIKNIVPVAIFDNRKFLTNSISRNIDLIMEIFGVSSIDELTNSYSLHTNSAFYKKSNNLCNNQKNIFAWSKLVQWKAKSEIVSQFLPENKDALISELKEMFLSNSNVIDKTKMILGNYGIKFLVVEKFNKSPIDGYSFWSENNPAIVLTLRKKSFDNFIFVLLHELGHIFLHISPNHTEYFLEIECVGIEQSQKEEEADNFANQSLMDDCVWSEFLNENTPFDYKSNKTERNIKQFARKHGLHQSIVLGRYKFFTKQYKIKANIETSIG